MKKLFVVLCGLMLFSACGEKNTLVGEWVQPIPGMESQMQGINLQKDGKASSINMYTLVYDSWKQEGNKLVLTGKSIGNGQEIEFRETYPILKNTADELVLDGGDIEQVYHRRKK